MILLDKIEVSSFLHHSFDPSSFWGRHLIETGMVKNRNHWSIVVEAGVEVLDAFCRLGRALFCAHGFGCRFGWFGRTRVEINLPITRRTSSARTGLGAVWNIRIPSTKFVERLGIELTLLQRSNISGLAFFGGELCFRSVDSLPIQSPRNEKCLHERFKETFDDSLVHVLFVETFRRT